MTRTSSTLGVLLVAVVTAVAAVPAAGSGGYHSVNATIGDDESRPSGRHTSINAVLGDSSRVVDASSGAGAADGRSVRATLGERDVPNAAPSTAPETGSGGGFRWGDALLGALVASLLLLTMLGTSRSVARYRRSAAGSGA